MFSHHIVHHTQFQIAIQSNWHSFVLIVSLRYISVYDLLGNLCFQRKFRSRNLLEGVNLIHDIRRVVTIKWILEKQKTTNKNHNLNSMMNYQDQELFPFTSQMVSQIWSPNFERRPVHYAITLTLNAMFHFLWHNLFCLSLNYDLSDCVEIQSSRTLDVFQRFKFIVLCGSNEVCRCTKWWSESSSYDWSYADSVSKWKSNRIKLTICRMGDGMLRAAAA